MTSMVLFLSSKKYTVVIKNNDFYTSVLSTEIDKTWTPYVDVIKEALGKTGIFPLNLQANQLTHTQPTNVISSEGFQKAH